MDLITREKADGLGPLTPPSSPAAPTAPLPTQLLPEQPLIRIEAGKSWLSLDLRDMWAYRELLFFLIWRDLKVRYKQTALGVSWVIMQPLLMTIIFTIFLGVLARVPSDGVSYPVFAYAGLLPWTFFANSVANSGNSLVGSAGLITKVYFPRIFIPAAAVGSKAIDLLVSFVVLAGLIFYYQIALSWKLILLPAFVVLLTLFALGFGMLTSALNVKYRDVGMALPMLMQVWMFASPVIYPSTLVPGKWRYLYMLNPLVGIIEGFRAVVLGRPFDRLSLAIAVTMTVALLAYAAYLFRRVEKTFADVV